MNTFRRQDARSMEMVCKTDVMWCMFPVACRPPSLQVLQASGRLGAEQQALYSTLWRPLPKELTAAGASALLH